MEDSSEVDAQSRRSLRADDSMHVRGDRFCCEAFSIAYSSVAKNKHHNIGECI